MGTERTVCILLVEDHGDSLRVMSRLLRMEGYHVYAARGVQEAAALAAANACDILISDIGLADGSGLDLVRQLKGLYPLQGIALSGYAAPDDVRAALDAGFDRHLCKPVLPERLFGTIRELIG